jgi:Holliday junction resolvase
MTEQAIQKKIITMLEKDYNAYVVKVQVASKSGVPDLLCCVNGHFIGIEVKRPSSKTNVSRLQEYNLHQIRQAKGLAIVAWSTQQVEELLNELGL